MELLRDITCIEVEDGVLLSWEPREGIRLRSVTIYASNDNRDIKINSPLIKVGRCRVKSETIGLAKSFKIKATDTLGKSETSIVVNPQLSKKSAKLLLREIRRREHVMMKAHPFGVFNFSILMKKQYGTQCSACGNGNFSGLGGSPIASGCDHCIGTGIEAPYIVYPEKEEMIAVSPKEDAMTSPDGVNRFAVTRTFRTVFDNIIREDDIIITANEAYTVQQQQVISSVGNTPAVYMLTCVQILPKDPRYESLLKLVGNK